MDGQWFRAFGGAVKQNFKQRICQDFAVLSACGCQIGLLNLFWVEDVQTRMEALT
jgi:hypothetical protein